MQQVLCILWPRGMPTFRWGGYAGANCVDTPAPALHVRAAAAHVPAVTGRTCRP
jgi:hypothetical protein